MKRCSFGRLVLAFAVLGVALIAPVFAGPGNSRWASSGIELGYGNSATLNFQQRLFQPGLEEKMCNRCRQYLEFGFEWEEFDDEARSAGGDLDVDSTAFAVGYRYYVLTGDGPDREKEGLAAYLAVGIGRYDLDPGEAQPGYFAKAGLEYPLTQSGRKHTYQADDKLEAHTLKKVFWSVVGSVRYDEVERGASNLDNTSVRVGIRMVIPSKRDRRRADCLLERNERLDAGETLEQILKDRPRACIEPDDLAKLSE